MKLMGLVHILHVKACPLFHQPFARIDTRHRIENIRHSRIILNVHIYRNNFAKSLTMTRKRDIGAEILGGIQQLKAGKTGRMINIPPVSEIREKTGLSQSRFAALLGVSVRTLQDWEQGRRAPSGAARTLLLIAHKNPLALLEVA